MVRQAEEGGHLHGVVPEVTGGHVGGKKVACSRLQLGHLSDILPGLCGLGSCLALLSILT